MLFLLVIPVIGVVALAHRYLQIYAPSNLLVATVRESVPRWWTALGLLALGGSILFVMHILAVAVAAGAPGWVNVLVLVLAWDALKILALAGWVAARRSIASVRRRGTLGGECPPQDRSAVTGVG